MQKRKRRWWKKQMCLYGLKHPQRIWLKLSKMDLVIKMQQKALKNSPSCSPARLVPWPVRCDESFNAIHAFRCVFTEVWVFPLGRGRSVISCSAHWATQHQQFFGTNKRNGEDYVLRLPTQSFDQRPGNIRQSPLILPSPSPLSSRSLPGRPSYQVVISLRDN